MPAENTFARLADDTAVATEPAATEGSFAGRLTDAAAGDTPQPPPPMPEAGTPATPTPPPAMPTPTETKPDQPSVMVASTQQAQTAQQPRKADGWQVDWYELRSFGDAVVRARAYLDAVQAKVDRMQGAELTPQLGTSPVGTQLAKKFDDRLNSADGLRAMLAEAMKRMEDFVTSAETAARAYEDNEETTVDTFTNDYEDGDDKKPVKNGG
jgi:hypothetical protein